MKILAAEQIREADELTLSRQGIELTDLVERAANAFVLCFLRLFREKRPVQIFCGPGNNGNDALAIGRLLYQRGWPVEVFMLQPGTTSPHKDRKKFQNKMSRFLPLQFISHIRDLPIIPAEAILIDGLFGTGLNRPLDGLSEEVIGHITDSLATVVAVDIPSGLFADRLSQGTSVVKAHYTITFELPKLAFFMPENEPYVGIWTVAPIGLDAAAIHGMQSTYYAVSSALACRLPKQRARFSHKGTYGHALLLAGSKGKIGAAVLAARACLRTGVGLLTVQVPEAGYQILQTSVPEAMVLTDAETGFLSQLPELEKYQAIGIGPGIGTDALTGTLLRELLQTAKAPLVLDADALNLLSQDLSLLELLPPNSILTPHPKEFERLTSPSADSFERLRRAQVFAQQHKCFVVLKEAYTCTCTPEGTCYFNTTGNAGMATGGTGDVLTGILTSLMAQGYEPLHACLLGVYLHGLAGNISREQVGEHALIASDVVLNLGEAYLQLQEWGRERQLTAANTRL